MLPEWLAAGLAIAAALAVGFAALFAVGERLFPTRQVTTGADSGDPKRRAEIREYLDAIGERYAEDHPVAGEAVAFYLPERDVAITFDPRAYFRIEQTPTVAVLVEHELPGAGLGARLPFDVPPTGAVGAGRGHADGGTDDPHGRRPATPEAAFRTLGLDPGASPEEVRRAYRDQVKEVHPDHGGDEQAFRRVREAYATAASHAS